MGGNESGNGGVTSRPKKAAKASSPYQKYGKSPYHYEHPNCSHKSGVGGTAAIYQSTPTWSGKVCSRCNIILQGPGYPSNH